MGIPRFACQIYTIETINRLTYMAHFPNFGSSHLIKIQQESHNDLTMCKNINDNSKWRQLKTKNNPEFLLPFNMGR